MKEQPLSVAQPPSHKQVLLGLSLQFQFSCQTISRVPKNPPKQREMKYVCIYDVSKFNTIYDQKKILTLSTSLVLLQIIHSTKSSLSVTQEPKRSIVYPLSQNDFMGYGNKTQQTSSEANKARVESCVLVPSPCLPVLKGQRPTTHSRTLTLSLFHS